MSLFDWFADRRKGQFVGKVTQESEESDGLWEKCPECGQVVYRKDLVDNCSVCSNCGHHNRIDSKERIRIITDKIISDNSENFCFVSLFKRADLIAIIKSSLLWAIF